ncbi:riboflavin biosynthesis protein RibD [Weizmannia acidilactici]|uniref:Riboflavin biosynthesis protein RibD n=1 Tax=Weizmannia acidilactici TaxID=2607726 RepID=A0A5J4J4X5_9BACI|nr:bifunctional diaminohydroxyphosphoribosylaminopyrimidine deaminase/5-amino-6-(5-phosphoribosylamino)uracil reductase RibD [Weizmannia acidilactici]GER70032.1 riboflavin biosynthesis protein RibD [Weizmannia acidilactici]
MRKEEYMQLALRLAESVSGQTSPNPPVGSVVVKNGRIAGMAAHLKAGEKHAERLAVEQAGVLAQGAEVYVTLEPCSHYGKTPPCADFLIEKGIKKVYVAARDPNPLVAGKGIEKLKQAGIEVETGICREQAETLYRPFYHFIETKMPFVTIKTAMSADGKIATETHDSKWITSEQARMDVHQLRSRHDAILVGIQTVLHDNPLLTSRLPQSGKNPIRIVLDTHLRILPEAAVINKDAPSVIFCGKEAPIDKEMSLKQMGVEVIRQPHDTLSIREVLLELGKKGILTLLVEGGAEVNGSFLREKAVQQLVLYIAPKVIGGNMAPSPFGGRGIEKMDETFPLVFEKVEQIGPDLKITAAFRKEGPGNVYGDH